MKKQLLIAQLVQLWIHHGMDPNRRLNWRYHIHCYQSYQPWCPGWILINIKRQQRHHKHLNIQPSLGKSPWDVGLFLHRSGPEGQNEVSQQKDQDHGPVPERNSARIWVNSLLLFCSPQHCRDLLILTPQTVNNERALEQNKWQFNDSWHSSFRWAYLKQ